MTTFKFSWPEEEIFSEAMVRTFALIEGAYYYDVEKVENIYPLKKHTVSIEDENGNELQKVMVDIWPEGDEWYAEVTLGE